MGRAATSIIFVTTKVLLQQTRVCHDKTGLLPQQKYARVCCDKNIFVAASTLLLRQKMCFIMTNIHLWCQTRICGDKHVFVATKLLLWQKLYLWQLRPMIDSGSTEHVQLHSSTTKTFHIFICTHSEFQGKAGAERWQHVCEQGKASSLLSVSPGEGAFTSVSPSEWTFTYIRLTRWMDVVNGRLFLSVSLSE